MRGKAASKTKHKKEQEAGEKRKRMIGRIVKAIAGFYYVNVVGEGTYACKAKGAFRREKKTPLVGDMVEIEVTHEQDKEGNVVAIQERTSELERPPVANVDQALIIFAATSPEPNLNLLDRFLIQMEAKDIPVIIGINKIDLVEDAAVQKLREVYEPTGYPMICYSVKEERGLDELKEALRGKLTTVAGPSGVGKSSLINKLQEEVEMEVGELSAKIERGKQTTRHTELIQIDEESYICDTPGFSTLYVPEVEAEELADLFPEFREEEANCKFRGCNHMAEPGCAVKAAVEAGRIHVSRYENYRLFYEERKQARKY